MSGGRGSDAPSVWSTGLRHSFEVLEGEASFGMLVAADNERSEGRAERLTQSTASVPDAILWFLLITLTVTVIALGLCLPRRNNRAQIAALVVITALLTTALCIIRDVDRPFGGITDVRPTAMADTERQATRDFRAHSPLTDLPCDEKGLRKAA